jgi:hypothetical protein
MLLSCKQFGEKMKGQPWMRLLNLFRPDIHKSLNTVCSLLQQQLPSSNCNCPLGQLALWLISAMIARRHYGWQFQSWHHPWMPQVKRKTDLKPNCNMNHCNILSYCRVLVLVQLEGKVESTGKCKWKKNRILIIDEITAWIMTTFFLHIASGLYFRMVVPLSLSRCQDCSSTAWAGEIDRGRRVCAAASWPPRVPRVLRCTQSKPLLCPAPGTPTHQLWLIK